MSRRGKPRLGAAIQFVLFIWLTVTVATAVVLGAAGDEAAALDTTEWEKIAGYLDSYIDAQYVAGDDGEAGFLIGAAALKTRIDSNGDNTYLGEGDDAAGAPVLVDVLSGSIAWLPATSYRVNWDTDAASTSSVSGVKGRIEAHEAAGFSTDIVTYCQTGHTESVVAGAYGAIAQAGGFGGSSPPQVLDLKWGRYGWDTGGHTYGLTKNITASTVTPAVNALPTNASCAGSTPDSELVRCVAANALTTVGSGTIVWDAAFDANHQPVDIRSSFTNTMAEQTGGGAYAVNIPLQNLFDSAGTYANLKSIDPSGAQVFFTNRTQHTAGIAAVGATMLGYNATFAKWGLPDWNNTLGEQYTVGQGYSQVVTPVDFTAPVISGVSATPTSDGATIAWNTDEPATSVLEWSLASGGPYTKVNDTVLHAAHSQTITGQAPGSTIYYRVSSYDGQANGGTPTTEASVLVTQPIDHAQDNVYYMPWYDDTAAWGWMGAWVVVGNISGNPVNVEVRVNGVTKGSMNGLASGDSWFQIYPNLNDGMVEVICWDCKTAGDDAVVSQRSIFKNTFNEYLAVEWDNLSDTWYFPWYDNTKAWGWNGSWIVIANPDTSAADVTISIDGSAIAESPVNVPAGSRVPVKVAATTNAGPVVVDATGGQKLLVTERVLFKDSFNEVAGLPIPTP